MMLICFLHTYVFVQTYRYEYIIICFAEHIWDVSDGLEVWNQTTTELLKVNMMICCRATWKDQIKLK